MVDTLVFRSGRHFKVTKPEDLEGRILGLVRGYAYPYLQRMIADKRLRTELAKDEQQLLEMLARARFDQILINQAVAQYSRSRVLEYREFQIGDALGSVDISMRVHPEK